VVTIAARLPRAAEVRPSMDRKFTCPACGHEIVFDPARCPWSLTARPGPSGRPERTLLSRVRCSRCGQEHQVPLKQE
jgi:transcription elongation factor Elf1